MVTKSIPNAYQIESLTKNTNLVSLPNSMGDTEKARTIRLPQWLWDEIDRDGIRCNRSAVKQLETVLAAYYRGDVASLNEPLLEKISSAFRDARNVSQTIEPIFPQPGQDHGEIDGGERIETKKKRKQ